jgi:CheY-like chemotaxis protein
VLSNLSINAVDAMPSGGALRFCTGERGGYSFVSVEDTGYGISPEQRPRIFEPFYSTKKGSGLGLTISRNIVERHEGTIQVASVPGAGSTFTVRLRSCTDGAASVLSEAPAPARPEAVALSVLVVDDEEVVRDVLSRLLERAGHRVTTADSGRMGIAALEQQRFDLLICDLGMPDTQGPTVMQRAHGLYPEMPIVLTTGWGDSITPEQLRSMRAVALLPKPFGQQEVAGMLQQVLTRDPGATGGKGHADPGTCRESHG